MLLTPPTKQYCNSLDNTSVPRAAYISPGVESKRAPSSEPAPQDAVATYPTGAQTNDVESRKAPSQPTHSPAAPGAETAQLPLIATPQFFTAEPGFLSVCHLSSVSHLNCTHKLSRHAQRTPHI
jgi:hypothetical protein